MSSGGFSFNIAPGAYRISASAAGFVQQEYGQAVPYGDGRVLFLKADQQLKDVIITLPPTNVVNGQVFDPRGRPAAGASVQLFRRVFSPFGSSLRSVAGSSVNDRGQYRLFDVPAGRYYLFAGTPAGLNFPAAIRYRATFYPDTTDVDRASPIDITPGSDAFFTMTLERQTDGQAVRGRIIDPTGSPLPPNLPIGVLFQSAAGNGAFGGGPNQTYDPTTGNFELRNIPAGTYTLSVQTIEPSVSTFSDKVDAATVARRLANQVQRPLAQALIRVVDSDLENVILSFARPTATTGHILIDGSTNSRVVPVEKVHFSLVPTASAFTESPVVLPASSDGAFEVRGLWEGEYSVRIENVIPGYYVGSVQYGGDEVLSGTVRVSPAGPKTFEMMLRPTTSTLSGIVMDELSRPVTGIRVVLVPSERNRTDLYRIAITDAAGKFAWAGLAPGDYKAFSWASAESGAYYDPNFVRQYDDQVPAIKVTDSSAHAIEVRLIP
jgi:hypothetical protein